MRKDRSFSELRKFEFIPNFNQYAEGSCLVKFGNTHVICTASIEEKVPFWLKNKATIQQEPSLVICSSDLPYQWRNRSTLQ